MEETMKQLKQEIQDTIQHYRLLSSTVQNGLSEREGNKLSVDLADKAVRLQGIIGESNAPKTRSAR